MSKKYRCDLHERIKKALLGASDERLSDDSASDLAAAVIEIGLRGRDELLRACDQIESDKLADAITIEDSTYDLVERALNVAHDVDNLMHAEGLDPETGEARPHDEPIPDGWGEEDEKDLPLTVDDVQEAPGVSRAREVLTVLDLARAILDFVGDDLLDPDEQVWAVQPDLIVPVNTAIVKENGQFGLMYLDEQSPDEDRSVHQVEHEPELTNVSGDTQVRSEEEALKLRDRMREQGFTAVVLVIQPGLYQVSWDEQ